MTDLRAAVEKALQGTRLRPWRGQEDVLVADVWAVVGGDTLLVAESGEHLNAMLERAERDGGFPVEVLGAGESGAGIGDPLVVATRSAACARPTPARRSSPARTAWYSG